MDNKKQEAKEIIKESLKSLDKETLLIMEHSYGDVKYSNSNEDLLLTYECIVDELNNRKIGFN